MSRSNLHRSRPLSDFSKRLLLALGSTLVALVLAEFTLRAVRPELRELVDTHFERHAYRIHANPINERFRKRHPDTRTKHLVIHNSHGFRQHRDFQVEKPPGTTRVGFFGDSFTENLRIESQYSLTEPLDYLLNRTGIPFEVLNFGTDGYGIDQIYLQYADEAPPFDLDTVIYIHSHNDVRDILANQLFTLDSAGDLQYLPQPRTTLIVSVARRFYLTYLVLDAVARIDRRLETAMTQSFEAGTAIDRDEERRRRHEDFRDFQIDRKSPEVERALEIYVKLITRFKRETEERGQEFVVVMLPRHPERNRIVQGLLKPLDVRVVDLLSLLEAEGVELSGLFFENDAHWNEEGNKLAAVQLFKALAQVHSLPNRDDEWIREGLGEYYGSFDDVPVGPSWLSPANVSPSLQLGVRSRYLALER